MKEAAFIVYMMIGIGVATGMTPTPTNSTSAFLARMGFWPIVAGTVIAEHRQFIRDSRHILRKIADKTGD